jgi:hypothetical protein
MKKFEVNVNGVTYVFEYNRASFVELEENGTSVFGIDFKEKPLGSVYKCLIQGLKINHSSLKEEEKTAVVEAVLDEYELGDLLEVIGEITQSFFIQGENKKKVVRR